MPQKILVLAPHTDDAELGCGGTIARFCEEGREVFVASFSGCEASLPLGSAPDRLEKEMIASLASLGVPKDRVFLHDFPVRNFPANRQPILDSLIVLRQRIKPELVFLPSRQDVHQDHEVIHEEGVRAFRQSAIWCYELPWNHIVTETRGFVGLERRHVDAKIAALNHYESQRELARPYFREELLIGLAAVRGVQIKRDYAEAFQVERAIL